MAAPKPGPQTKLKAKEEDLNMDTDQMAASNTGCRQCKLLSSNILQVIRPAMM